MSVKRMFLIGIKELLGNVGQVPVSHLVIITPVPNNADFANVPAWNGLTISLHLFWIAFLMAPFLSVLITAIAGAKMASGSMVLAIRRR